MLIALFKSFIFVTFVLFGISCSDTTPDALVESYTNDLNNSILPTDKSVQINVYENYSDGKSVNVSSSLIWSSTDESLATVEDGLVTTYLKKGVVEIGYETSLKLNNGLPLHKNVLRLDIQSLILEEIKLSQTSLETSINTSHNIKAKGIYENNLTYDITNSAEWLSSNTDICNVEKGVVSCAKEGNVTITCLEDNITSDTLFLSASTPLYSQIKIYSDKTTFNAKQTIELSVKATTSEGELVTIDNSELNWNNNNPIIVDFDTSTAIATARVRGDATISVELASNSELTDSISLNVDKEEYMRLFRGDTEIAFPFADLNESESISEELETFSMIAVGRDFTITELSVRNFYGTNIPTGWFDNLLNYDTIEEDENRTFELMYTGEQTQLHYYFKINDDYLNNFSMKYTAEVE